MFSQYPSTPFSLIAVSELVTGRTRLTLNAACLAYLNGRVLSSDDEPPPPPRAASSTLPHLPVESTSATATNNATAASSTSASTSSLSSIDPIPRPTLRPRPSPALDPAEQWRAAQLQRYLGATFHLHLTPTPAAALAMEGSGADGHPSAPLSLSLFSSLRVLELYEHQVLPLYLQETQDDYHNVYFSLLHFACACLTKPDLSPSTSPAPLIAMTSHSCCASAACTACGPCCSVCVCAPCCPVCALCSTSVSATGSSAAPRRQREEARPAPHRQRALVTWQRRMRNKAPDRHWPLRPMQLPLRRRDRTLQPMPS